MRPVSFFVLVAILSGLPCAVFAADEPDGTTFQHSVLAVDGADTVRIKFCGVPVQIKLANLQFKGAESEKSSLGFLKETLKPGTLIKIELEPEANAESPAPPMALVFAGTTNVNVEMVKRGFAVSDGRSKKYGPAMQTAQMDAMSQKRGIWAGEPSVAVAPVKAPPVQHTETNNVAVRPEATAAAAAQDTAPEGYDGAVVADLSSKEYHYPASRFAKNIRAAARIEYKSPEEAERAGKIPSPFSFPDRAKALAEKQNASGAGGGQKTVESARKAYDEALLLMQEARKQSRSNNAAANDAWKKAAKLIGDHLDRVIPIADSDPNNKDLQKLTEDMSMSLYSCKKYQSL